MTRQGLRITSVRIVILIVLTTVAKENTSELLDLANEVDALYDTTSSSTLRMPGISPLERS